MLNESIEIWKPINGYEGIYEISNHGRVKTLSRDVINNRPVKEAIKKLDFNGPYPSVGLSKNGKLITRRVHRLVANAFIPNPECKNQVNHKDTNKRNNHASNLEWCSSNENMKHAYDNGLLKIPDNSGENNSRSKLTSSQVKIIRDSNKSVNEIANAFSISRCTVFDIRARRTWAHI